MSNHFCPKCGNVIPEGATYCSYCGTTFYPSQRPQPQMPQPQMKSKDSGKTIIIVLLSVLIGLLVAGGLFFLLRSLNDHEEATPSVSPAKDTVVVVQQVPAETGSRVTNLQAPAPTNPTEVVVTGTNVRLRKSPYIDQRNPNSNTLIYQNGTNVHPYKGEALRYLGDAGDFYYVEYKGFTCYISKKHSYLR